MFPFFENHPIAPQYGPLPSGSRSLISFDALIFGAPTSVPIGKVEENASSESLFSVITPVTSETRCITYCKFEFPLNF